MRFKGGYELKPLTIDELEKIYQKLFSSEEEFFDALVCKKLEILGFLTSGDDEYGSVESNLAEVHFSRLRLALLGRAMPYEIDLLKQTVHSLGDEGGLEFLQECLDEAQKSRKTVV